MIDEDSDHGVLDQAALQVLRQENANSSDAHALMDCLHM